MNNYETLQENIENNNSVPRAESQYDVEKREDGTQKTPNATNQILSNYENEKDETYRRGVKDMVDKDALTTKLQESHYKVEEAIYANELNEVNIAANGDYEEMNNALYE